MVNWMAREYFFSAYNDFAIVAGMVPFLSCSPPFSLREAIGGVTFMREDGEIGHASTEGILDAWEDHNAYIRRA